MQPFILPDLPKGTSDGRLTAPAARRNMGPILDILSEHAPKSGRSLEIAAGTGEHAVNFARAFPDLHWQPTDIDSARRASIAAWSALYGPENLAPPIALDAGAAGWAARHGPVDMILLVNLLHLIDGIAASNALMEIVLALAPGGTAFLYGPFLRDGQATSDGDARFHASLRAQDPAIGYKELTWVRDGLQPLSVTVQEMPANNLMLIARPPV